MKKPRYYKNINEKELDEILESIISSNESYQVNNDESILDFLDSDAISYLKKIDVIHALDNALTGWYVHMGKYIVREQFEVCIKIQQAIQVEIDQTIQILEHYFADILTQEDYHLIDDICEEKKHIAWRVYQELKLNK